MSKLRLSNMKCHLSQKAKYIFAGEGQCGPVLLVLNNFIVIVAIQLLQCQKTIEEISKRIYNF